MYNKTLELGKLDFKDTAPKDAKAPPKECPVETRLYPGCSFNCCPTVDMIEDTTVLKAVKKPVCASVLEGTLFTPGDV